jgi:hypothetical protein
MLKTRISMLIGSVAMLAAGCASQPRIVTSSLGPTPPNMEESYGKGDLQVFTETEMQPVGDSTYYYPHTDYDILNDANQRLQNVPNHIGPMDQNPTLVTLPAGKYRVRYRGVTVPVGIAPGRTTVVHLDGDWHPPVNASSSQIVRLPNGEAVGWQVAAGE